MTDFIVKPEPKEGMEDQDDRRNKRSSLLNTFGRVTRYKYLRINDL